MGSERLLSGDCLCFFIQITFCNASTVQFLIPDVAGDVKKSYMTDLPPVTPYSNPAKWKTVIVGKVMALQNMLDGNVALEVSIVL